MLDTLNQLDHELFLYLNGLHQNWLDQPMIWITEKWTWLPFYALILGFLFYKFRKKTFVLLIILTLGITASDQFSSSLIKPLVKRYRPNKDPELKQKTYVLVNSGNYGFISSHAANSFSLLTFLWLVLKNDPKRKKIAIFMIFWASLVSYSRIYVGVHYPADIILGACAGILLTYLVWQVFNFLFNKK
ncbi:MAG: phosphatase PAP2 family protein [Bacteroidetes bacterium]|nr:MAG: phosphatase PAP2 family protein [Bacteroidota bacterium]